MEAMRYPIAEHSVVKMQLYNMQLARLNLLDATWMLHFTSCNLHVATYSMQLARYNLQDVTSKMRPVRFNLQDGTYRIQLARFNLHVAPFKMQLACATYKSIGIWHFSVCVLVGGIPSPLSTAGMNMP